MKEDKDAQKRVDYIVDKMSKVIGVQIPKREYPLVILTEDNSSYNPDLNYIRLRETDKHSGEVIGHELGEFFREKLKQQRKQEPLTFKEKVKSFFRNNPKEDYEAEETHAHEFFGYLGTRILKELVKERKGVGFGEKREPIKITREHVLTHARPSRFANQLDFSEIYDFKKLFSLPDREVKHRFFRTDPQYNLNKPVPEAKITKRKPKTLETIVKLTILPVLMLVFFFFLEKTITGNIIKINSSVNTLYFMPAIIIGIIIIFIALKISKYNF
jgi:hypothetical protein